MAPISLPAAIGFIALTGIAVMNGVVWMVRALLARSLDQALLAQAAVESVSLFTRLLDSAALAHRSEPLSTRDLSALVASAVAHVRPEAARHGLTVSLRAPAALTAMVRPHALRQAIENLLSNALKFAVRTIDVELARAGTSVRIRVADDGPGIPPSEHEHVFEPFHRLHHGRGGAGLGLAIVREVARAHDGRAYVENVAQGASVVLELLDASHELPVSSADAPVPRIG